MFFQKILPCVPHLGSGIPIPQNPWLRVTLGIRLVILGFLHSDIFRAWTNNISIHMLKLKYVLECFSKLQPVWGKFAAFIFK